MCSCVKLGTDEQVQEFNALLQNNLGNGGNVMEVLQKTQGIFGI